MHRSLQELIDDLYAKMTPQQRDAFERGLREEINRLDRWLAKPTVRKKTKRKAAKKR